MRSLTYIIAKHCVILVIICLAQFKLNAQTTTGSIVMKTTAMPNNEVLRDMMRFYDMEYYTVNFTGDLKGKDYSITVKEIWNGKIKNVDTLFNSASEEFSFLGKLATDTLSFRIAAAKKGSKKLKMNFYFNRIGIYKEYKSTSSNSYSLRDVGTQLPITTNKPFYAFAYILPYELKGGGSSWCAVESSGKDIEHWGTAFGIKHYLLIEMNFTNAVTPAIASKK